MYKLGKRWLISLALLILISIGLAACGGSTPTSTPQPTSTTAAAASSTTPAVAGATDSTAASGGGAGGGSGANSADASLLQQAASDMKALKSYHIDITVAASGQNITMAADVDAANNKLKMDTKTPSQSISVIAIGSDVYLSTDGGKTFTPSAASGQLTQPIGSFLHMWDNFNANTATTMTNALKEGNPSSEQIDGVDTKHLSIDSAALGAASGGAQGTVDLWISTDSNPTIRQMKAATTTAGQTTTATIKWNKFNEDPGIKAPTK